MMSSGGSVDLSRSSFADRAVSSWDEKSGSEKILIMACVLLSFMVLGFIVGTASLKATERNYKNQISELKELISECEAGDYTGTTTKQTTPSKSSIEYVTVTVKESEKQLHSQAF